MQKANVSPVILLLLFFILVRSSDAYAGFVDKLNEASRKMQQASNNMNNWNSGSAQAPSPTDSDRPLNLDGYQGHCNGQGGATCLDYMDKAGQCMAPLKGYRAKLTADLIERKLSNGTPLSPELRKNLQEDLIAARTAQQSGTDTIVSTPSDPQRYLMDISEDDQVEINSQFGQFYQKIMNKCMGADHMGIGRRTEMNYIQDNSAEMAQRKKEDKAFNSSMECMKRASGIRWQVMADMTERKMNAQPNLSAQERQEWQEDILVMRNAYESQAASMPQSPDPKNPMRYMMRLTSPDEQMEMNNAYMAAHQKALAECQAIGQSAGGYQRKVKTGGPVDHSTAPGAAQYNTPGAPLGYVRETIDPNYVPLFKSGVAPTPPPPGHPQNNPQITEEEMLNTHSKIAKPGSLSAALGATDVSYMKTFSKCADPLKGLRTKLVAQVLQYKLDQQRAHLSPADRVAFEADIRAAWDASAKGLDRVDSPDPNFPRRPEERLNSVDGQDLNQELVRQNREIMQRCNGKASTMTAFN